MQKRDFLRLLSFLLLATGPALARPPLGPAGATGKKRILVIGLSGGAWVEILRHLPEVVHIDVVEIQPLYLDLITSTPAVSGLLKGYTPRGIKNFRSVPLLLNTVLIPFCNTPALSFTAPAPNHFALNTLV